MGKEIDMAQEREPVTALRNKKGRKKAARAEDRKERRKYRGVCAEKRYKTGNIVKPALTQLFRVMSRSAVRERREK
jgi:hypothetical protein